MVDSKDAEVDGSVQVSLFDESVENHFKALDTISTLCGEKQDDPLCGEYEEIKLLSSNMKFLREWKQFQYQPKEIKFATGSVPCGNVAEVVLPQFSSAAVPQGVDGVTSSSTSISKDFVVYVGGSVWALDWCPRFLSDSESIIRCEFFAVAAHPPDSCYHKMGVPLCGRGMVQIWCFLNINDNAKAKDVSQSLKKSGESKPNEGSTGRGRPKKNLDDSSDNVSLKRPRGRPRKIPMVTDPGESNKLEQPRGFKGAFQMVCVQERSVETNDSVVDIDAGTTDGILLLDNSKKEVGPGKRKRGRPRKDAIIEFTANASEVSSAHWMTGCPEKFPQDGHTGSYFDKPLQPHELDKVCTHFQETIPKVSYQRKKIDDASGNIAAKRSRGRSRTIPIVDGPVGSDNLESQLTCCLPSKLVDSALTASTQFTRSIAEWDKFTSGASMVQSEVHCSTSLANQNREKRVASCSASRLSESVQIGGDANCLFQENTEKTPILSEGCHDHDANQCDGALDFSVSNEVVLPRMVFSLAHNGKVVWDMKWKRHRASDPFNPYRLGYLAVLLGNGTLEVWDVPLPSKTKNYFYSACEEGLDPRFVKLEPVFRCSPLKCGDTLSIPLTMDWSNHDEILVGCHDGTIALWKFSPSTDRDDTRPFLCFCADTVPIRAVAWSPLDSDEERASVILTAGHVGLQFWDIRDPYRPLWDLHPAPRYIYSVDWLQDPKCIMLSFDDGTLRLLSLVKSAYDAPVHGDSTVGPKQYGLHAYSCSSFAIWSVQVSRLTGMVAYCSADGSVNRFQLTKKAVEKDPSRHRTPHHVCGLLSKDGTSLVIDTTASQKAVNKTGASLGKKNVRKAKSLSGDQQLLALPGCSGDNETSVTRCMESNRALEIIPFDEGREILPTKVDDPHEIMPSKMVSMHRVRWNMNRGSERWLCSGGAAGVVRLQEIVFSESDIRLANKDWPTKVKL